MRTAKRRCRQHGLTAVTPPNPTAADAEAQYATATLKDIKHLVEQLRLRDERMSLVEQDLRRLADDYRRLREDVLPALRLAKEQQPLPPTNNGQASYGGYDPMAVSPAMPTPSSQSVSGSSSMPKRQASTKKIVLGGPGGLLKSQASSSSPTHLQTTHDRSFLVEQTLDPSSAAERAVLSSQHLAAMNGSNGTQQNATSPGYPPNMPSPTSPPTGSGLNTSGSSSATLNSRFYRSDQPTPSSRTTFSESDNGYTVRGGGGVGTSSVSGSGGGGSTVGGSGGAGDKPQQQPPRRNQTPAPDTPSSNASVEIFKSFRVSMDDPCYKVLPAALRKYQINAPWDQYALYIVYGDQERCLGLDEKPLILFKQLDKEGKKPMFMLRKTNNAQVDLSGDAPGSAGLSTAAARGAATGYDPPGGII